MQVENPSKKLKVAVETNASLETPPLTPPSQESIFLSKPLTCEVIGVPFSAGQPKKGTEFGPSAMINANLLQQLEELDWKVSFKDHLSLDHLQNGTKIDETHPTLKNLEYVAACTAVVHHHVKEACEKGHLALTLGGDHSLGIATVSGSLAAYPNLGVIWVDAHADINTSESTESGNLHGCPVSFLLGLGAKVKQFEWLQCTLKAKRIVYIGLRDVDEGEKKILKDNNILAFSMKEVDKFGIAKVMTKIFDYLGHDTPIHLSFDVDALDPNFAPSTGTLVRGGLTFREGHYICEEIAETNRLVSMDLMEVNPELGEDEIAIKTTISLGCSLIRAALGETLL